MATIIIYRGNNAKSGNYFTGKLLSTLVLARRAPAAPAAEQAHLGVQLPVLAFGRDDSVTAPDELLPGK